ncbi:MAG: DUF3592 domain-containing protein [Hyphomicrobiales bacterium]
MLSATALLWTRISAGIASFFVANLAYAVWKARRQASSSRHWPTVQGDIIASEAKVPKTHTSDDDTDCSVAIRYRYRVGAKDYEGSNIHAGPSPDTTRRSAEELAAKYPVGSRVEVHYRPDRPATAVLEPKDTGNFVALVVFLVVFCCIAVVLIAHSIAGKVLLLREGGVPLFAFLLPLACIAIAVGGVFAFVQMRKRLHESALWPTTAGTITSSAVTQEESTSRDDEGRETTATKYRADIRFAYKVGGREFHSSQWKWGWTSLYADSMGAQAIVAAHPQGRSVRVYYDPKEPETAVLEPGNKQGTLAPLVVSLVFGGGGALIFWAFTLMRQ